MKAAAKKKHTAPKPNKESERGRLVRVLTPEERILDIKAFGSEIRKSKESATTFLQKAGILDDTGELAEPFRATTSADELLDIVESTYSVRNYPRTMAVLRAASFLLPILLAIPQAIAQSFGEECPLALEVISVGESDADDELIVQIQSRLSADEALKRLGEFDDSWWLDRVSKTNGKLTINVEFV